MDKKYLRIGEDLDGFLGYDSDAVAQIDIEASQAAYEEALKKRILEYYPDTEIEFAWGGNSYYDDFDYPEDIQTDVEMWTEQIYNMQSFWVMK